MSRTATRIIIGGLLLLLLAAPGAAHAEDLFPIVRCGLSGQPPCQPCDIWATAKRLIDLLVQGITIPIGAFIIVYAGIMMLLAAGNPGKFQSAKTLLTNAFIGIGIILSAWLITNFLIKSLARGNVGDRWYEFSCPESLAAIRNIDIEFPPGGPVTFPSPPETPPACSKQALASTYRTPAADVNAPGLVQLMSCLERDPIVMALQNPRNKFTYELSNPLCNQSRGLQVCGVCSHAKYSCHYGGKNGAVGAQAVDYNWNGNVVAYNYQTRTIYPGNKCPADPTPAPSGSPQPTPHPCRRSSGEEGLYDEIYRAAKKNNCTYGLLLFHEGKNSHSHVSIPECDSDEKKPAAGRPAPAYP